MSTKQIEPATRPCPSQPGGGNISMVQCLVKELGADVNQADPVQRGRQHCTSQPGGVI
jgi:hypothetical protein